MAGIGYDYSIWLVPIGFNPDRFKTERLVCVAFKENFLHIPR